MKNPAAVNRVASGAKAEDVDLEGQPRVNPGGLVVATPRDSATTKLPA
jgi:hypothetical protein